MKPASTALQSLLATDEFYMADLYTITLLDSTVIRLTTADIDIVSGGNIFSSQGPVIERGSVKWQLGLEVDTLEITAYPTADNLVEGEPFLSAVRTGALDGAELQLERAFMPTWGDTSAGTVVLFVGRIGEIEAGRTSAKITVNSHLELLSQQMPRNLYMPGCTHTLFDSGCALLKSNYTASATVQVGATISNVPISGTRPDGYYSLGTLLFTSGANEGLTRTIKYHAGGVLQVLVPLPAAPAAGDTLSVTAGCDKTQATCQSKFSNIANFRGFPYVPAAEIAQ